jgi:transcriptional regulator with XRE-family HTH domain
MVEKGKEIVSTDIGRRLRMLREERQISMRALARASGLSANALSMIERGLTSPSVSTLSKLANALEIPITALFRRETTRHKVVFCKALEREQTLFGRGRWEELGGDSFDGRLEAYVLSLEVGGSSGLRGIIHSGQEFVYCLHGVIEYEVDHQNYLMEAGDSLMFEGHLQHRWRNSGNTEAGALIVFSCFDEDEHPGEFHLTSAAVSHDYPEVTN